MSPVSPSPEAQRSASAASAASASQAVAAIVLAGATALLPASSLPAASGYQPVLNDPFASATTHTIPMPYDASGSATDVINFIVPRWRRYVEQRLRELSLGAHNFTGLRVPSGHVVDLAARVAQDWFYPDTPTPSVLPSEDGEVLFVWHKAGWDLEIIVGPGGAEIWAYDRGSGKELSGSLEELGYATSRVLMRLAQA